MSQKEIILYSLRELHLPVLMPLYRELKKRGYENVGFMAPPFLEGTPHKAEEGLRAHTLTDLERQGIPFWGHYRESPADCVFLADVCYERVEGWGKTICVGHGTISKNIYFIDEPIVRRENFADLLCVPGPWYVDSFGGEVKTPIVPTGFSKMDELLDDHSQEQKRLLAESGFNQKEPLLLFAPTFNPELSGHQYLFDHLQKITEQGFQVFVKLHGATDPMWKEKYRFLCSQNPKLFYVESPNLIPPMLMVDAMISDYSSAYVEYLTQDKPLFLYNNPQARGTSFFNPKTVEIQVRQSAYEFSEIQDFLPLLKQVFSGEDPKKDLRAHWKSQLFPPIDGKNSARIIDAMEGLFANKFASLHSNNFAMDVYIPFVEDEATLLHNLENMRFPGDVYSEDPTFKYGPKKNIAERDSQRPLVILTGAFHFPKEFDHLYSLWTHWFGHAEIAVPVLPDRPENLYQQLHRYLPQRIQAEARLIQTYCKYVYFASSLPISFYQLDGVILKNFSTNHPYHQIEWEQERIWKIQKEELKDKAHCFVGMYGVK